MNNFEKIKIPLILLQNADQFPEPAYGRGGKSAEKNSKNEEKSKLKRINYLIRKFVAKILNTRKKKLFLEKKALLKESHSEPQEHESTPSNPIIAATTKKSEFVEQT